jgi:hypothetical protein
VTGAGAPSSTSGEDGRVHELSQQDARRIALRAQLLTAERPSDLMNP